METAAISRSRGRKRRGRRPMDGSVDRSPYSSSSSSLPPVNHQSAGAVSMFPTSEIRFSQFIAESLPFDGGRIGSRMRSVPQWWPNTWIRGTSMTATAPITASLWQFRLSESTNETANGDSSPFIGPRFVMFHWSVHKYVISTGISIWFHAFVFNLRPDLTIDAKFIPEWN